MTEHEPNSRPGINRTRLAHIAAWSIDLHPSEANRVCTGIVRKTHVRGAHIHPKNTLLESWTGMVTGLIKVDTVSPKEHGVTFTGVPAGDWSGEGAVFKNEPRRCDTVTLHDMRMIFMNRATFVWLMENSVAFSRFLAGQLNERLGHFVVLLEYDRLLDVTPRLARCIASLFNPVLYLGTGDRLEITQKELGLLSDIARQVASQSLRVLEKDDVVRLEYGSVTVVDLDRLHSYGV